MEIKSHSPLETKEKGKNLAKKILKDKNDKKAKVLALEGDLGGGKTTFLQGFAKGLGIKDKILSPTFVLMKKFEIPKNKKFKNFYHFDCYRIKGPKEISELGFNEIVSDPQNIIAIEWAERIRGILPTNKTLLKFNFLNKKNRKIWIKNV
ncbi:MAG: tRNA (adenosine(37)-N6)-threonylcarbamoyltransferase complex ATPase subunit type 1 TsaE [Candidatus Nealsonbacteria bacterium]|nr:tRNA (adenosine(37)-N6)-threonylcarbamoyltransferase complex ATPase subunit type 1 TsaE [Candidatus Nealsonbacteria bacterium]